MKNEGEIVKINGKTYTLGKKIGGGFEGSVFNIKSGPDSTKTYDGYVIKIINDTNMTSMQKTSARRHFLELERLGDNNRELRQIMSLPRGTLDDGLGYVMVKAGGYESLKNYLNAQDDFTNWYGSQYTLKKRYHILISLFHALREIHLAGLIFTDLSPNNIMVHREKNSIVFIDTDNLRKKTDVYLSVLGTPGYMAPEIYRNNIPNAIEGRPIDSNALSKSGKLSIDSDIFSAAVIAFEILSLKHPFIGDVIDNGTPDDEERALRIETDYIFKKGTGNSSTSGLTSIFNDITTPEIRELFYRTFVDGKENPNLRPTDRQFLEAFQNVTDQFVECPSCHFNRIFSGHGCKCIGCDRPFEDHVVMTIYAGYEGMDRAECINSINKDERYDLKKSNLLDEHGNEPPDHFELSKIVLQRGVEKKLFLRHFERNIDRSKPYASVLLSKTSDSIAMTTLNNHFDNAYVVNKKGSSVKLSNGKEFGIDHYVVFERKPQSKGFLTIYCKLEKY